MGLSGRAQCSGAGPVTHAEGNLVLIADNDAELRGHLCDVLAGMGLSAESLPLDSNLAQKRDIPILTLYRTCRHLVETEAMSDADRRACRSVLRQYWTGSWNGARLVTDVLSIPFPGLVSKAFDVKFRLFGAPGNFHR